MNVLKGALKPSRASALLNQQSPFIRRWPKAPKIALFAQPGVFGDEYSKRLAIDLGVPLVSMEQMLRTVTEHAGLTEEFSHRFYLRVRDIVEAGDEETLIKEKIPLKLLRLSAETQRGFILMDFPEDLAQAEMLEEYRGGLNAFVHLSLPSDVTYRVEASKIACTNCGKVYYSDDVVNQEHEVYIERFMPHDGCDECGNKEFKEALDTDEAMAGFTGATMDYSSKRDELLAFYNHLGLLVDVEPRRGYADYEKMKRELQFNIKH